MEHIPTDRITGSTTLNSLRLAVALAAALAGALMAMRSLQLMANAPDLGGALATVARIQSGVEVESLQREKARVLLRQSHDAGFVSLAGVIAVSEAQDAGVATPNGQIWLKRAATDLRRGLARTPADGLSWMRLAAVESLLNGSGPAAVSAFRMASYNLRNDDTAVPLILVTSMQLWPDLDDPLRAYATMIVKRSWASTSLRRKLAPLALSTQGRSIMLANLGPDAEVQAWIDQKIAADLAERRAREQTPPK